ncbi:leptomycin B resistance protein pmd1 [Polychaeton citri CBS 116435]|uniref:Leptomycin B resistance protein pmd1 n=1 Tax=Polychaeton citri CBS 116435 TaxID=1314669 RepID=A0A9P4ULD0_9PEZI|nr:leptomycin B resistance protein pmd1 [Polychaeton citri CBS 116435]
MAKPDSSVQHGDKDGEHNEVLDHQLNGLPTSGGARTVLSFATPLDLLIIVISCLAAIVAGGLNPLLTVLYGSLVGSFDGFRNGSVSGTQLRSDISKFSLYFVYLAIGMFVSVYITTIGFYYTGERITKNLRRTYLKNIVRQNMAFFDTLGAGELTTRITSDITLIQEGMTGNLSVSLTAAATFISAYVIAFIEYWKLALILTSTVVLLTVTGTLGVALPVEWTKESLACYGRGATVAEEAISSIRHVTAFGIQESMIQRYDSHLKRAKPPGFKSGVITALMISVVNAVPYLSYGLSFWEGSRLLVNGEMSISGVTTSTLAIVIGAWAVGRVAPNAKAFVHSIASATAILESIARKSTQDPFSDAGECLESSNLDITFRDTQLIYPSRREVKILNGLNLVIPASKTTAIVGASGCGKSSIIGLLERFYQPTGGEILLGDHDLKTLNLSWLRSQISLVSQEPTLFNTSIFNNITYGLEGKTGSFGPDEMQTLVAEAAKKANAHDFIANLPQGYHTEVGEKGTQLSGGQRQRICIARAIIRSPRILLLDEATSALDVGAERAVQKALSAASKGRTTIVIAHRLSTIRDADNIVVMADGDIIEQGTHNELVAKDGEYAQLVEKQRISEQVVEEEVADEISGVESATDGYSEKEGLYLSNIAVDDASFDQAIRTTTNTSSTSAKPKKASFSWSNLTTALTLITKLSQPEYVLIIIATLLAIIAGLSVPAQSVIFAKLIDALSLTPTQHLRNRVDFWSLMYLVLGIAIFAVWLGHGVSFAYTTEKLTHRAREQSFRHILRQNVGYFDMEQNSIGALTSLLSSAPSDLNGLSGPVIGALLTFVATILGGIILSLAIGWKLALVCTATIPFVAGFGYVRLAMLTLFAEKMKKTHQDSAAYASEASSAIRTVASFNMEAHVLAHYNTILSRQSKNAIKSILQASVLYAASQSVTFLCAALAFWYGGTLISRLEYSVFQFFICFAALISGAQTAGVIFSYAPGMSRAMGAAQDLKALFERHPEIDNWDTTGKKTTKEACTGRIEFRNVSFSYPSRKNRVVVDDFSICIKPGQYIALVGPSGCGKSTLIALMERFFDPTSGQILIDGQDISTFDVSNYRSLISLVGQEPTLYSGTIRENLVLGSEDNVTEEEIVQACKEANIYDVITSLPNGFATDIGSKGVMLSGGQKQRIAIARALLRNTKILLLDEATAALDSVSEQMVQQALNKAAEKRTTIAVAHRLKTIQNADVICVLEAGKVAEVGNHRELMAKGGVYKGLVDMQNLGLST